MTYLTADDFDLSELGLVGVTLPVHSERPAHERRIQDCPPCGWSHIEAGTDRDAELLAADYSPLFPDADLSCTW